MISTNLWEELNSIPEPPLDYDNDTDLDLETLMAMDWQLCGSETSKFSSTWADNYVEPSGRYAKKYLVMVLLNFMNWLK